jgi:hypothetical protein
MRKFLKSAGLYALMAICYIILIVVVIVLSPLWAFTILTSPDSSTQSNAMMRK